MQLKKFFVLICALVCALVFTTPICCIASASNESYSAKLDDLDNSLTDEQEIDLIIVMNIAAQKIKCNIGVVITDDLEGKSSYDYSFDYLDSSFGVGSSSIVLLLCNDQVNEDCIATDNLATDKFGSKIDSIFDEIYNGLDSSDYYGAINNLCTYLEDNNIDISPADNSNDSSDSNNSDSSNDNSDDNSSDSTSEYSVKLDDFDNCLNDSEERDLIDIMTDTAATIECNIGVVITADLKGMSSYDYAFDYLDTNFGAGSSSIVLLLCNDHVNYDWIATDNRATDMFGSKSDRIFDYLYKGLDSSGYYAAVNNFCAYLKNNGNSSGGNSNNSGSNNSGSSSIGSGGNFSVKLDDLDNCLNDNEKRNLINIMEDTAERIECNIGVVITADLKGMSSYDYSFDYLDSNFGAGSSSIVLLLCNDHINYDWIATDNRATDKFGSQTDKIFDYLYRGLDKSGYYAAIDHFCTYLNNHNTVNGNDYFEGPGFSLDFEPEAVFFILIFSFVIAFCFTKNATSKYSKKAPISAKTYLDKERTEFTLRNDIFVREFTTSHHISESSSGHHSGGRGGGGGRSRSGRGGGGGRRR
ncbi:MAG: TPM domain-containing protein [Eubacterium sp.]|nr:TPM domain-containing protein [Eubacterium sp.]